jgi:hypothetical protein
MSDNNVIVNINKKDEKKCDKQEKKCDKQEKKYDKENEEKYEKMIHDNMNDLEKIILQRDDYSIERLESSIPLFKVEKWNSKIEKVVKLIEKQCRLYKKMHNEVSINNTEKYSWFMISAIVFTPMSGVILSIGTILGKDLQDMYVYNITSTILSLLSGILITIIKFNKYDEISYSHKTSASRYISLEENIKRQLLLYEKDRINATEYLNWLSKSFDELFDSAPNFDSSTLRKYKKQIETLEKEYDDIDNIDFKKQDSERKTSFLQYQDLNKYNDIAMKIEMKK